MSSGEHLRQRKSSKVDASKDNAAAGMISGEIGGTDVGSDNGSVAMSSQDKLSCLYLLLLCMFLLAYSLYAKLF